MLAKHPECQPLSLSLELLPSFPHAPSPSLPTPSFPSSSPSSPPLLSHTLPLCPSPFPLLLPPYMRVLLAVITDDHKWWPETAGISSLPVWRPEA